MLIIGEKINTTLKEAKEIVARKDTKALQDLAKRQIDAGACIVDVNVVNLKLRDIMTRAFHRVLEVSLREKVDMRTAALMVAVRRVAEATRLRGLYP